MSNEEIRIQKKNEYKIWINYNPYRTFTEFLSFKFKFKSKKTNLKLNLKLKLNQSDCNGKISEIILAHSLATNECSFCVPFSVLKFK